MTGRSIAIHSFKGGTGKSTLAANLAVTLASKGRRVGVMDMDLEGPGLHVIFNIDPSQLQFTLNDVLLGAARPEQAVVRLNERFGEGKGEVYFSPASVRISDILRTLRTGFEIESFSGAIESLQKSLRLDYMLIDTHPGIENDTLLAMGVCADLILVSRIDQQDVFGTAVMAEVARSLEKPTHLVMNMIPHSVRESQASRLAQKMASNFNIGVLGWLPFSDDVIGSLSKSIFVLTFPNHLITSRFRLMAEKLDESNGRGLA